MYVAISPAYLLGETVILGSPTSMKGAQWTGSEKGYWPVDLEGSRHWLSTFRHLSSGNLRCASANQTASISPVVTVFTFS